MTGLLEVYSVFYSLTVLASIHIHSCVLSFSATFMQNCNTSLISIDFWFSVVVVVDCMRRIWPFWLLGVCIGSILKSSLLLLDCNLSR